jgi:hypothetical protein
MRQSYRKRMRPEGGVGVALPHRNQRCSSSGAADSGDKIRRPGSVFTRGRRGEIEGRSRGFYRRSSVSNQAGNRRNLIMAKIDAHGDLGRDWREVGDDPSRWVPPVSRRERGRGVPVRGAGKWVVGLNRG